MLFFKLQRTDENMNFDEFCGQLLWEVPSHPTLVGKVIFELFPDKWEGFTEEDLARAKQEVVDQAALGPQQIVIESSTHLVDLSNVFHRLQPEIEAIRESLLGSVDPLSPEDAEGWIIEQGGSNLDGLSDRLATHARGQKPVQRVDLDLEVIDYPIKKRDLSVKIPVVIYKDTLLYQVVNESIRPLVHRTGFDESNILRWVLTNTRPVVPAVDFTLVRHYPFGNSSSPFVEALATGSPATAEFVRLVRTGQRTKALAMLDRRPLSMLSQEEQESLRSYAERSELNSVRVTFNSHVTFRQLYDAYKKIRGVLPKSKPNLHCRIQELVREKPRPKTRWNQKYWKEIQAQLIEEGYKKVPKDYKSVAQIYYRNEPTKR